MSAAQAAAQHAVANQDRRTEADEILQHDVKLALDRECQDAAEHVIMEAYPEHSIVGEESITVEDRDWQWVIDPIDGTVNFFHGLPWWCSSVAVAHKGTVLAGAVCIHSLGQLYTATADGPALLNGHPIHASSTALLSDSMVATGLSRVLLGQQSGMDIFDALSHRAHKLRIMGAAAIDICHVASGALDGYFEASIYWWDIAAAGLIAERAGACTQRLAEYDGNRMAFMATNGLIHDQLRTLFLNTVQLD